jgi:hypothetical protein
MPEICGDMVGDRPSGLVVSYWLETQWEMHPSGLHFIWTSHKGYLLLC